MNRVIAALHRVDHLGRRPGRLRQARQLPGRARSGAGASSTSPPRPSRSRRWTGSSTGCRRTSRRRRDHDRPRRLPARQHDLRPRPAAVAGRARLGTVDARTSARRLRLSRDGLSHPAAPSSAASRGLDHAALGIPTEREYIARYCERTGRDGIDHYEFYLAYNAFRLAAILQGIMKRAVDGTAASAEALETGRRAKPLARIAWSLAEKAGARA